MEVLLSGLSAHFFSVTALALTFTAAIAAAVVIKNEMRRSARRQFRLGMARGQSSWERGLDERYLAQLIAYSAASNSLSRVENAATDRLLREYIIDLDFKRKLYRYLLAELVKNNIRLSPEEVEQITKSVEGWRTKKITVPKEFSSGRIEAWSAAQARKYLRSKDNYFEEKRNEMIDDVRSAIRVAAKSSRAA